MKKKSLLTFLVAACLSLCLLGGFSANGGIKADAAATTQETSVTQIYVEGSRIWIGLSDTDYDTNSSKKGSADLSGLNTLNKIKVDGNYAGENNSKISSSDPYINLWSKLAGSFTLILKPDSELVIEQGCQFPSYDYWMNGNADGVIYEVKETVTFKKSENGAWAMVLPETDISATFGVNAGNNNSDSTIITLSTAADISAPTGSGKWLMDNMTELQNYLTLNGKSVKQINDETDDSAYVYTEFPGTLGGVYAVPVRVMFVQNGNNAEFKFYIHNDYYKTLSESLTIGIKAGFARSNTAATANMAVKTDVAINIVKADATVNFFNALNGGSANGYYHAYVYTNFFKGNLLGYAMIDGGYKDLTKFLYINEQSVYDINKNTDTSGWDWSTSFPQNQGDTYHVPVMLYVGATESENADKGETKIEIKIHENYMKSVEGDLTLTVKGGIKLFDNMNKTMYGIDNDAVGAIYYKTYKLTINVDGKDTVLDAKHTLPLDFTNFCQEKTGYTFSGWFTDSALTTAATATTMPASNYTVYGKYNAIEYTAKIVLGDGSEQNIIYTIENRAAKLEEMKGLLSADSAQYAYTNDLPTELPLENGKTYTESRTVKEYDVVIGDAAAVKKAYGSKLEKPQDPTKANTAEKVYAFDGWYNGETKWNFETDTVTGDVTIVAKFTESARRYTVTINFTGLNKEQVQLTLEYGKKVDFTAYNENGYTFVIKNGEEKITEFTVTGDATLTVEYAKVQAAKKGCGGSIGGSAAVLAMLGFAALALRKKNK